MDIVMEKPATSYAPFAGPATAGAATAGAATAGAATVGAATVGAAWVGVCRLSDLSDSWGEAALVNGRQLALFRVGRDDVFAVAQADPATRAHVMSRGLVGSRGRTHTIASPLHKEVYSLATGECFGRPELHLGTYPVRVVGGVVEVSL